MHRLGWVVFGLPLILTLTLAHASSPPCQSGVGGTVFATGQDVEVKIVAGNVDAGFTSELYLNVAGQPTVYCGTNKEYGRTTTVSNIAAGAELAFFIYVRDTGYDYTIGGALRNPDGVPHASVTCGTNGSAIIGFEDLWGGGDLGYNDMYFELRRLDTLPRIITPPADQVANLGGTATFVVEPGGSSPFFYQWLKEGAAIPGATDPSLSLSGIQKSNEGIFSVVVSNAFGSVVSPSARLTVNLPPAANAGATALAVITRNGSNAAVILDASRSSDPEGDYLQYAWYESGNPAPLANGVLEAAVLPLGSHRILLVASDETSSSTNAITVQILTTKQGVQRLINLVNNQAARPQPLTATLSAALASMNRNNWNAATNQLNAFLNQVRAQVAPGNSSLATQLTQDAQNILNVIQGVPGEFKAIVISPFQINLAWSDALSPQIGFRIERSSDGRTFTQIAQVLPGTHAFQNRGLFPDSSYSYRVRPYTRSGNSAAFRVRSLRTSNTPCELSLAEWGGAYLTPPSDLGPLAAIAAGSSHVLALKTDGTIVGWGDNTYAQAQVPTNLTKAVAVTAGSAHSLALKSDGTVVGWGDNTYGQATPPAGLTGVVAIASGDFHNLALKSDGSVIQWGAVDFGRGAPPTDLNSVVAIAAGANHSLALRSDRTVVAWGNNDYGQTNSPPDLSGVIALAAGNFHSLALKSDGTVTGWGANGAAQALPPTNATALVAIAAGNYHSLALKGNHKILGWGYDSSGQVTAPDLGEVEAIAAGGDLSLALVTAPAAPVAVSARITAAGRLTLFWQAGSDAQEQFKIERTANNPGDGPGPWLEIASVAGDTRQFADTAVVTNTMYWYRMRAQNTCGNSQYSAPIVINFAPPVAPYNLSAHLGLTNGVDLSWDDYSGNSAGFKIERSADVGVNPGAWTEIAAIVVADPRLNSYSYNDPIVTPDVTYSYRVRAFNALGFSAYRDTAVLKISVPPAPNAVSVYAFADRVNLNWYEVSAPVTFRIERAEDDGGAPGTWQPIGTNSGPYVGYFSYQDPGRTLDAMYWYRVQAINWVGASDYSSEVSVTIVPPAAPTYFSAKLGSTNEVDLAWYQYPADQDGFKVERASDVAGSPGAWSEIASFPLSNTYYGYYVDTNLVHNTTNWYRVRAFNVLGLSPYSATVNVRIAPPDTPFAYANTSANRIYVIWNSPYGLQGYRVQRAPDVGGTPGAWTEIADISPSYVSGSSYMDTVFPVNVSYWYRVQAYNWVGDSPFSLPLNVAPIPPFAPQYLSAYIGTTNSVNLAWQDYYSDYDGFKIERAPDINGSPGIWTNVAAISNAGYYYLNYTDTNAVANTTNWYRVRAFNIVGDSDPSPATVIALIPPSDPQNLYGYPKSDKVYLSWSEYYSGVISSFKIERAPDIAGQPGTWAQIADYTVNFFGNYFNYIDTGRAANATYWYRVRASTWIGDSHYSSTTSATIVPPQVPYNLFGYVGSTNRVNLSWYDYSQDEDGFNIQRAPDVNGSPGTWTNLDAIFATNAYYGYYTDTNVLPRTTNWYRVQAFNVVGTSDFTVPASVQVVSPPAPSYLSGSPFKDQINLSWYMYYSGEIGGYYIERAPDVAGQPGTWTQIAQVTGNYNYYSDTGRAADTTYWYRVRAYNWVGESPFTDPVSVKIVPPATPSSLYTSFGNTNQVYLYWYDFTGDEDGFKIERASDIAGSPGTWSEIASFTTPAYYYPSFTDTNALGNTTNWYRVRAFNSVGISDYSLPASIRLVPPDAPYAPSASVSSANLINLYWYTAGGYYQGFRIERAPDTNGAPATWAQIAQTFGNYYSDSTVQANRTYWYRVRGYNWTGDSPYSGPAVARTSVPNAPTNLTAVNDWRNQISVGWAAPAGVAGVSGYRLERAPDNSGSPGSWLEIATLSSITTGYQDSGREVNKTYWYRVRAYNSIGDSPFSNVASALVRAGQFVRLMQWNVERNLGRIDNNYSYAASSIARVINYNQPDILLFNEIDTAGLTPAQNFAALVNWVTNNVTYLGSQPGSTFYVAVSAQSDGFIRNAAISRFPLPSATTYNDGLRGLHSLRVQLSPANSIQLFHAHLKCCADDCARKQSEAQFDADIIHAFAQTNALPYLFAGDWNEEEERQPPVCTLSDTYHPITTIRQGAGLAEFKPTTLENEYRTWSSQEAAPSIRFDYILSASNRLAPESGFVFNSVVWANHGLYYGNYYDSYYASDHYCVFANYFFQDPRLSVSPAMLAGVGYQGGPFTPASQTYTLSNTTSASLDWSVSAAAPWLTLSATNGALGSHASATVIVSINTNANALSAGSYQDSITFSNLTDGAESAVRLATVTVNKPTRLVVTPAAEVTFTGPAGGPFIPAGASYSLSNPGISNLVWTVANSTDWLILPVTNGTLAPGASTNVGITVRSNANGFAAGNYVATLAFTNQTDGVGDTTRHVNLLVTSFGFFDDFSTFTSGNLVGQKSWAQALAPATLPLQVAGSQLVIPFSQNADNQDAYKNFTATSGALFYGFTLNISNAPASASPSYFAALAAGNGASGFANYRLSARDNGGGTYVLAARITGQAGDPYTFGGVSLGYGTQHRVIVATETNGAIMRVFVDPTSPNLSDQVPYLVNTIGSGTPPVQSGSLIISQFGSGTAPNVGLAMGKAAIADDFALLSNFLDGRPPVALFADDFESGNLNNWTTLPSPATPLDISQAQNHSAIGGNSARVDISTDRMYHNLPGELLGRVRATFWIYDDTPGNVNSGQTRWFGELRGYSGSGFGDGSLQQLLAIGRNGTGFGTGTGNLAGESVNTGLYQGRLLTGVNSGFFNVNVARSVGWHKFEIERAADGTTVNFYVDGALGRSIAGASAASLDTAIIGSVSLGSTAGQAWFDDLKIENFPPPLIPGTSIFDSTFVDGADASSPDSAAFALAAALTSGWLPQITSINITGNDVRLTWSTMPGLTTIVQSASSLSSGFEDLSPAISVPGTETSASFVHAGAVTNSPARYYRIRVVH